MKKRNKKEKIWFLICGSLPLLNNNNTINIITIINIIIITTTTRV